MPTETLHSTRENIRIIEQRIIDNGVEESAHDHISKLPVLPDVAEPRAFLAALSNQDHVYRARHGMGCSSAAKLR